MVKFGEQLASQLVEEWRFKYFDYEGLKKMVDEQEIVMNLADILADAFLTESVVLKIKKLQGMSEDKEKLAIQTKMMEVFLYEALDRTRKNALDALGSYPTNKGMMRYVIRKLLGTYVINAKDNRRDITAYLRKKGSYSF